MFEKISKKVPNFTTQICPARLIFPPYGQKHVVFPNLKLFGQKFGQMAIYRVVGQKHVVLQTRNCFGLKFWEIAIFRVVCQKHVVFANSKLCWAQIWTNGVSYHLMSFDFIRFICLMRKSEHNLILI